MTVCGEKSPGPFSHLRSLPVLLAPTTLHAPGALPAAAPLWPKPPLGPRTVPAFALSITTHFQLLEAQGSKSLVKEGRRQISSLKEPAFP